MSIYDACQIYKSETDYFVLSGDGELITVDLFLMQKSKSNNLRLIGRYKDKEYKFKREYEAELDRGIELVGQVMICDRDGRCFNAGIYSLTFLTITELTRAAAEFITLLEISKGIDSQKCEIHLTTFYDLLTLKSLAPNVIQVHTIDDLNSENN